MVHLFASVHSGYGSAINVFARYGSAARGDPLYEANALFIQQVTGALRDFPREYQGESTGTLATEIKGTP